MKLIDLIERRHQKTNLMYHGTSSIYLKSILKHGLLANPPRRTYDGNYGNQGYDTYGGIYLTPRKNMAEEAAEYTTDAVGGEPMVIMVQYVQGSGNIDEDIITHIINQIVYNDFDNYDVEKYETYNEYTDHFKNTVIDDMVTSGINRLQKIGRLGKPVSQALHKLFEIILNTVTDEYLEVHAIMDVVGDYPKYKHYISSIMQNITTKKPENTQVLHNIGFKGKTRIIQISIYENVIWSASDMDMGNISDNSL